jgi:putative membrane protein
MTDVYSSMFSNAVAAIVFAIIGVLLFILAFMLFDKLTPGSLWKELIEDQNTALGVLMGAVAIALAIIIAAAVHGGAAEPRRERSSGIGSRQRAGTARRGQKRVPAVNRSP